MLRQQLQLSSKLLCENTKEKENLADKIIERGQAIGIYKKGSLTYRRMSKDVLNRITTRAMKDTQRFQEKMIYSAIKGKAYTLKLGSRDALPEIERGANFLCQIYGRKKAPFEDSIIQKPSRKSNAKQVSAKHSDFFVQEIASPHSNSLMQRQTFSLPKTRFRRGVSQLIENCNSVLKEINN